MFIPIGIVIFFLGLIVGSFLNVVILRFSTGESMCGRSHCPHCDTILTASELIPVVSFLILRGKCSHCLKPLSLQYPIVELLTGLLFAGVFYLYEPLMSVSSLTFIVAMLYGMTIVSLLVVILVYDLKHMIIPNVFSYALAAFSFVFLFVSFSLGTATPFFIDLISGPLFFSAFFVLWFVSRGAWLGLGDAKLVLSFGWILGFFGGLSALLLAFWIGAVVGVFLMLIGKLFENTKGFTMKTEIPFAPFLIAGFFLVYFFNVNPLFIF